MEITGSNPVQGTFATRDKVGTVAEMNMTVVEKDDYVIISPEYYRYLNRRDQEFSAYENAGVDNWRGRDYAIEILREAGFYEEEE